MLGAGIGLSGVIVVFVPCGEHADREAEMNFWQLPDRCLLWRI